MNNLNKEVKEKIINSFSPETIERISSSFEKSKKFRSLTQTSLQLAGNVAWALENSNWILKPTGKVAGYANKPANAIYNDLIKPYYDNVLVSKILNQEKSLGGFLFSAVSTVSNLSNFVVEKKLSEKIEKISTILVSLDAYASEIEKWNNSLRELQKQEIKREDFAQMDSSIKWSLVFDEFNEMSKEEIDAVMGIDKLQKLELEEDFEIIEKKIEELEEDQEWDEVDWEEYENSINRYNDSENWKWLKKNHENVVALNEKIKKCTQVADLVRNLLLEIQSMGDSENKNDNETMLKCVLNPILNKLGSRVKNISSLINKEGWLFEDAHWLAELIDNYNYKVKIGSVCIEKGTDYLGRILSEREQKNISKEYVNLEKFSFLYQNKSDTMVFEEEIEAKEYLCTQQEEKIW